MYDNLRKIREEKGYSCSQMAEKLGVTKSTYSKKERGQIPITLPESVKIAGIFGGSVEEIFFGNSVSARDTRNAESSDFT